VKRREKEKKRGVGAACRRKKKGKKGGGWHRLYSGQHLGKGRGEKGGRTESLIGGRQRGWRVEEGYFNLFIGERENQTAGFRQGKKEGASGNLFLAGEGKKGSMEKKGEKIDC